jgi:hypothetical protein
VAAEATERPVPGAVGREQVLGNSDATAIPGLGIFGGKEDDPAAALGRAAERTVGVAFDTAANIFESLFAAPLTPEQRREAEVDAQQRRAETAHQSEFDRHMADLDHRRQQREQEADAARRQREVDRER